MFGDKTHKIIFPLTKETQTDIEEYSCSWSEVFPVMSIWLWFTASFTVQQLNFYIGIGLLNTLFNFLGEYKKFISEASIKRQLHGQAQLLMIQTLWETSSHFSKYIKIISPMMVFSDSFISFFIPQILTITETAWIKETKTPFSFIVHSPLIC